MCTDNGCVRSSQPTAPFAWAPRITCCAASRLHLYKNLGRPILKEHPIPPSVALHSSSIVDVTSPLSSSHSRYYCLIRQHPTIYTNRRKRISTTAKMGKVGRFACILTPMLLTLASLICFIIVMIGQAPFKGNDAPGSELGRDLYFFKVRVCRLASQSQPTHKTHRPTQATSHPTLRLLSTNCLALTTSTATFSMHSEPAPRPASSRTFTRSASGPTAKAQRTTRAWRPSPSARRASSSSTSTPWRYGASRIPACRRFSATSLKLA